MKYLILPLLLLTGCVSDGMMPATVEQVNDVRVIAKKNAEILAEGLNQALPETEVAFKAKHNADNIDIKSKSSSFDFIGESVIGLIMTSMGLGGVQVARKKIAKAGNQHPDEFNNKS